MPKHLFVGGPADGQWIDVAETTVTWEHPATSQHPNTIYTRRQFWHNNIKTTLFAPAVLLDVNVFRCLINDYKPPKEKE